MKCLYQYEFCVDEQVVWIELFLNFQELVWIDYDDYFEYQSKCKIFVLFGYEGVGNLQ